MKQASLKKLKPTQQHNKFNMPTDKSSSSKTFKPRNYDKESGKSRVFKGKKSKPLPPPESASESELSASESEVESEYEIKTKDVHRQKSAPARARKTKPQQDTLNVNVGQEAPEDEKKSIAPASNFLVALAYRQGTSATQFDARSFYLPDCHALFSAAFFICELISQNSLVHEFDPAFMSITFYLYVGHLFYYHILRVRDVVGELTREERRCLRHYENVGPAESWPIPTPLIAILESFGSIQPPSKYYGKIIPKLPNFAGFTAAQSLHGIQAVTGIIRVPLIPALQQFLHNFGTADANFDNGILYPTGNPTLAPGAQGNTFLGLTASAVNSPAQIIFFNSGWNLPTESQEELQSYTYALKRALISRFNVPDIGDTATITGLESFLGFRDGLSKAWMKNLLRSSSTVCRFFPGSSNLSSIGTTVQEEIPTIFTWTAPAQRQAIADKWYRGRNLWTYSFNGKVNTEQSGFLYKVAASASPNTTWSPTIFPAGANVFAPAVYSPERTGPYFANPAGSVSIPLSLVESLGQPDPIRNMLTFMDEQLYDNLGGRSRS